MVSALTAYYGAGTAIALIYVLLYWWPKHEEKNLLKKAGTALVITFFIAWLWAGLIVYGFFRGIFRRLVNLDAKSFWNAGKQYSMEYQDGQRVVKKKE